MPRMALGLPQMKAGFFELFPFEPSLQRLISLDQVLVPGFCRCSVCPTRSGLVALSA
jgi:hypothetical protein